MCKNRFSQSASKNMSLHGAEISKSMGDTRGRSLYWIFDGRLVMPKKAYVKSKFLKKNEIRIRVLLKSENPESGIGKFEICPRDTKALKNKIYSMSI